MRFLISGLWLFIFAGTTGCQGSDKSITKNDQEIRDIKKLEAELSPLVGVYEGKVSNPGRGAEPFPVMLNLYVIREQSGINEHGEPKYRPVLRGRYRRLDFARDATNEKSLVARFYPETRELILGSVNNVGGIDSGFLSITGHVQNDEIIGEIANHQGVLGIIQVTKIPAVGP